MGQTSSQPAPPGATQDQSEAPTPTETQDRNGAPTPTQTQSVVVTDGGDTIDPPPQKRRKTVRMKTSPERQARRALPQHRRGTAIRPSIGSNTAKPASTTEEATPEEPSSKQPSGERSQVQESDRNNAEDIREDAAPSESQSKKSSSKKSKKPKPAKLQLQNSNDVQAQPPQHDITHTDGQASGGAERETEQLVEAPTAQVAMEQPAATPAHASPEIQESQDVAIPESQNVQRNPWPMNVYVEIVASIPGALQPQHGQQQQQQQQQLPASALTSNYEAAPGGCILTPPESPEEIQIDQNANYVPQHDNDGTEHEEGYDPWMREGYVDPTQQIEGWLSQEFPAPPEQNEPEDAQRDQSARPSTSLRKRKERASHQEGTVDDSQKKRNTSKAQASNSRKRKRANLPQDDNSDVPEVDLNAAPASAKSGHRLKSPSEPVEFPDPEDYRPHAMTQYKSAKRGTITGQWTVAEKDQADKVFHDHCENNRCSEFDLRAAMVDWTNIGSFKKEIYEAFPARTIMAIRKFCQRRYTPYETGPWTEQEDESLKNAYPRFPDNWVSISDLVGRSAQACRDRWRGVVKDEEARATGPWGVEEEADLEKAVEENIQLIKEMCTDPDVANDRWCLEKMINWRTVSEKMQGTRNAKRCREKWEALERRKMGLPKRKRKRASSGADTHGTANEAQATQQGVAPSNKKQHKLSNAYAKLGPGDIFDALQDIDLAIPDDRRGGTEFHDETTLWSIVAIERNLDSKFAGNFGGKLRQRAYQGALEKYGSDPSVKKATGTARKASAMAKLMKRMEMGDEISLSRAYKVDEFPGGVRNVAQPSAKGAAKSRRATIHPAVGKGINQNARIEKWLDGQDDEAMNDQRTTKKRKIQSEAIVVESDDEEHQRPHTDGAAAKYQNTKQLATKQQPVVEVQETQDYGEADYEDMQSLRSKTPGLNPKDFLARCRDAGKRTVNKHGKVVIAGR